MALGAELGTALGSECGTELGQRKWETKKICCSSTLTTLFLHHCKNCFLSWFYIFCKLVVNLSDIYMRPISSDTYLFCMALCCNWMGLWGAPCFLYINGQTHIFPFRLHCILGFYLVIIFLISYIIADFTRDYNIGKKRKFLVLLVSNYLCIFIQYWKKHKVIFYP